MWEEQKSSTQGEAECDADFPTRFPCFVFVIIITIQTYSNLEFICCISYKKLNAIDTCMCLSSNRSLVRTNQNVYIN